MPASGSVLALASRLRALDDAALTRLVAERGVRDAGIRDVFDLAEALLDRAGIQNALQRLDRPTLALLAVAGDLAERSGAPTIKRLATELGQPEPEVRDRVERVLDLGLLGAESGRFAPWDAVVEQLRAWPAFGLPTLEQLRDEPPPPVLEPVSEADTRFIDRGAGDRAFATLSAVTELLLALREAPARRLARGAVALPDTRRLATAAGVDPAEVEVLLDIAARGGLAVADGAEWLATPAADEWLTRPRVDRWVTLADGWVRRLPEHLRVLLRERAHAVWGDALLDWLDWLYPAGGDWVRERAATAAREAELLGITGSNAPSTAGVEVLLRGAESARDAVTALFPAEVDVIYLQHDLTGIAPGPLRADLDARLRRMADVEHRGVASSYRITAVSLNRALAVGETEEGIRGFLTGISLTGLPQPLDYLIRDTAERFGSLRVGSREEAPGSYVRSDDTALLGQLAVDQALRPLSLERTGEHRLVSRVHAEAVLDALLEARYPAVLEDAAGDLVERRRGRDAGSAREVPPDTAAILVARVREGAASAPEETDRAWLARQLELAIKSRMSVTVTVRLPDDSVVDYVLEPAALAGGRLRARDRAADIERTLPLSSIVAVDAG